jgi:transposase
MITGDIMINKMKIFNAGPAPVISAIWEQLNIGKNLDKLLPWDASQCKLSPGIRIKALVINILATRSPLYLVSRFYLYQDLANLFGKGVILQDLNDDCLARALDKLAEKNPKKIISSIILQALSSENITITHLHSDTTSVSVYGEYENQEDDDLNSFIKLVCGHSKDHRPDLKQLKIGLCVNQDGIPIMGQPLDGNKDDKTWNNEFIDVLAKDLDKIDLTSLIYVADSALITKDNLKKMHKKLYFISRFPATFELEKNLIDLAWKKNDWTFIGKISNQKNAAEYKVKEFIRTIENIKYKFVVVHSTKLDKRKTKSIDKKLDELCKTLKKETRELSLREFFCKADAQKEIELFKKDHDNDFYPLDFQVIERTKPVKREGKGRPPKDYIPQTKTVYQIKCTLGELDNDARQKALEQASCFVLITNKLDKSPQDILKEYKNQTTVETSFRFLKSPIFLDAIYLKKESRIEALCYVLFLALFIYQILQRRMRKALEEQGEYIFVAGKVKTEKPTGNRILELLKPIQTIGYVEGDKECRALPEIPNEEPLEKILSLIGLTPDIYTSIREYPHYLIE